MVAQPATLGIRALGTAQRTLRSGSALLFAGQMLGNLGAYVFHMIMARMMTPADYGELVTITSISVALAVVVRTSQAWALKSVSAAGGEGVDAARRTLWLILRILLTFCALAVVLSWTLSGWIAEWLQIEDRTPILMLGVFVSTASLVSMPKGILLGLQRLRLVSMLYVLNPMMRVLMGFALVALGLGVTGGLAAYALGDILVLGIAAFVLLPMLLRSQSSAVLASQEVLESARGDSMVHHYPVLLLLINACLMLLSTADQVAVKAYFPPEVAGNFSVAFLLGRVIVMSTMALGWVVFTRAANAHLDLAAKNRLLRKILVLLGGGSGLVLLGYLLAPDIAVRVLGGAQYDLAAAYVGLVGIETTLFALVYVQVYYQVALRRMTAAWLLGLAALGEVAVILMFHETVYQLMLGIILVMAVLLAGVTGISWALVRGGQRSDA